MALQFEQLTKVIKHTAYLFHCNYTEQKSGKIYVDKIVAIYPRKAHNPILRKILWQLLPNKVFMAGGAG
jgi:hypothetical protein